MKQTRLYDRHVGLGGRMVPFADYELPVQYTAGPNAEHRSVRTAAGVFDIDHMGQFALRGEDALSFLQNVQVADVSGVKEWEARYSLLCYDDGTIVDDIFIYRLPGKWLIVVNAANREKDFTWLQSFTHGYRVELTDISERARSGDLNLQDFRGSSFTLTNLGGMGTGHFTPIIHHPNTAILGIGRAEKRPEWSGALNGWEPRSILPLSFTFDHRVMDGADGARFMTWIADVIRQPLVLALGS